MIALSVNVCGKANAQPGKNKFRETEIYNILDFGAKLNTLCTESVKAAIYTCHANDGIVLEHSSEHKNCNF